MLQVESITAMDSSLPSSAQAPRAAVPRLQRVDKQPLPSDALEQRRFGITIQSIHYYPASDGVCCAILLKTSFDLPMGDKLASALVPLSARPLQISADNSDSGANKDPEQINISGHFPSAAEWVEIARSSGSRDIYAVPNIGINMLGAGVTFGGVGVNRHMPAENQSYTISLKPMQQELMDHPTYLKWKYEDPEGIFYPPDTKLLVIVEHTTEEQKCWFPFQLTLGWKLRVDIHGVVDRVVRRLRTVGKLGQHEGWCFQIKGEYKPELARDALEDAQRHDSRPSIVGLHAAVKEWQDTQTRPPISSPPISEPPHEIQV